MAQALQPAYIAWATRLHARTGRVVRFLDTRVEMLFSAWIVLVVLAGLVKVVSAPIPPSNAPQWFGFVLPYLLIALSPIAGYRIATGSFPRGLLSAQPSIRLARVGKWQPVNLLQARTNPAFGPTGFLCSLLVGMLLNVPLRTLEYLSSVPALGSSAPPWAQTIFHMMTIDLIVMNFFYMVCFVMALRSIPLFPRMLLFAWVIDITMQLAIAHQVAGSADLPPDVAKAIAALLEGNIKKVLISAMIWLPYLILSDRVNLTFRMRVKATQA